jgi:hypothetical protein
MLQRVFFYASKIDDDMRSRGRMVKPDSYLFIAPRTRFALNPPHSRLLDLNRQTKNRRGAIAANVALAVNICNDV